MVVSQGMGLLEVQPVLAFMSHLSSELLLLLLGVGHGEHVD